MTKFTKTDFAKFGQEALAEKLRKAGISKGDYFRKLVRMRHDRNRKLRKMDLKGGVSK